MIAKIYSSCVLGIDAYEVTAEVDVGGGLPGFNIVGQDDVAEDCGDHPDPEGLRQGDHFERRGQG